MAKREKKEVKKAPETYAEFLAEAHREFESRYRNYFARPAAYRFTVGEEARYGVQASDMRFAVCTKPHNLIKSLTDPTRRTVWYTIIDFEEDVRGPENLVFGMGAETREQCEKMLDRLNGRQTPPTPEDIEVCTQAGIDPHDLDYMATEVSHRHRITLDIVSVDLPEAVAV